MYLAKDIIVKISRVEYILCIYYMFLTPEQLLKYQCGEPLEPTLPGELPVLVQTTVRYLLWNKPLITLVRVIGFC